MDPSVDLTGKPDTDHYVGWGASSSFFLYIFRMHHYYTEQFGQLTKYTYIHHITQNLYKQNTTIIPN